MSRKGATEWCHANSCRRSAVSRQACHLISVLSEHMGPRLEPLALAFLPALFKVVVITVQVSIHMCFHECHSKM